MKTEQHIIITVIGVYLSNYLSTLLEPVSPQSLLGIVTLETGVSCGSSAQWEQTQPSVSNLTALVKSAICHFYVFVYCIDVIIFFGLSIIKHASWHILSVALFTHLWCQLIESTFFLSAILVNRKCVLSLLVGTFQLINTRSQNYITNSSDCIESSQW